jgi:hypothetical protein
MLVRRTFAAFPRTIASGHEADAPAAVFLHERGS